MDSAEGILEDLIKLFPENDMSEMDASDFKDRAGQIMDIVGRAKLLKLKQKGI